MYGIVAHIVELFRQYANAVEIGAEADVLHAGDLGDVVDVVQENVDRTAGIGMPALPAAHLAAARAPDHRVPLVASAAHAMPSLVIAVASGTMKPEKKFTITTPSFSLSRLVHRRARCADDRRPRGRMSAKKSPGPW